LVSDFSYFIPDVADWQIEEVAKDANGRLSTYTAFAFTLAGLSFAIPFGLSFLLFITVPKFDRGRE